MERLNDDQSIGEVDLIEVINKLKCKRVVILYERENSDGGIIDVEHVDGKLTTPSLTSTLGLMEVCKMALYNGLKMSHNITPSNKTSDSSES